MHDSWCEPASELARVVIEVEERESGVLVTAGVRDGASADLLDAAARVAIEAFRARAGASPCVRNGCTASHPPVCPAPRTSDEDGSK